jgi:hypothetical protein
MSTRELPGSSPELKQRLAHALGDKAPDSLDQLISDYVRDRYIAENLLLLAEEDEEHLEYFAGLLPQTMTWWFVADLMREAGLTPQELAARTPPETLSELLEEAYAHAVETSPPLELPDPEPAEDFRDTAERLIELSELPGAKADGAVEELTPHLARLARDWSLITQGRHDLLERDETGGTLAGEYLRVAAGYLLGRLSDTTVARTQDEQDRAFINRHENFEAIVELLGPEPKAVPLPAQPEAEPKEEADAAKQDGKPRPEAPSAAELRVPRPTEPHSVLTRRVRRHNMSGSMYVSLPFGLMEGFAGELGPGGLKEALLKGLTPWHKRYDMLTRLVRAHGYEIKSFEHFSEDVVGEKILFLYHDVHVRDFIPALGLAVENERRGISSTFFLNWNFNVIDVFYQDAYKFFLHVRGPHAHVGFHGSPVSSWICHEVFGGDEPAYLAWIDTMGFDEVSRFINGESDVLFGGYREEDIVSGTEEWLGETLAEFRGVFGEIDYMSHHGDNLSALISRHRAMLDPEGRNIFSPQLFMDLERLEKFGLKAVAANLSRDKGGLFPAFPEQLNRTQYLENLDELLQTGKTIRLLNHPWGLKEDDKRITYNDEFFKRRMKELEG